MIETARPHYLLFAVASSEDSPGRWRFVLRTANGAHRLEASDLESNASDERLELISVVRGLEALEQPSRVTLVISSTYIREGVLRGLAQWKANGWRWECFGQMTPVKNLDLWQRIDRAMRFHEVDCRTYRIDLPHRTLGSPVSLAMAPPDVAAPTSRPKPRYEDPLELVAQHARRQHWLHRPSYRPRPWHWLKRLWRTCFSGFRPWLRDHLPLRSWLAGPNQAKAGLAARMGEHAEGGSPESSPAGPQQAF